MSLPVSKAAISVGASSSDVVAVEARKHQHGATQTENPDARGEVSAQRVISLTERRLADPAAVIAGLPPDTRPVPSVAAYDELLTRRRPNPTAAAADTVKKKGNVS